MNGGTISGRVYKNWHPNAPAGLWVSLESLTLGGNAFKIKPLRPEVQTAEGGFFGIGFAWYPQHVGKIDQHLRAKIKVMNDRETLDTVRIKVSLYISLGKIWNGMGGPHLAKELPDIINSWVDVHSALRKVPVPQILKQTGFMSPEAAALLGHAKLSIPG